MQILKTWNIRLMESLAFNPQQLNEISSVLNNSGGGGAGGGALGGSGGGGGGSSTSSESRKKGKKTASRSFRASKRNSVKDNRQQEPVRRADSFSRLQSYRIDTSGGSGGVGLSQPRIGGLPPLPREANVRSWGGPDEANGGAGILGNLSQDSFFTLGGVPASKAPPPLPPRPSNHLRNYGEDDDEDPDYAYIKEDEVEGPRRTITTSTSTSTTISSSISTSSTTAAAANTTIPPNMNSNSITHTQGVIAASSVEDELYRLERDIMRDNRVKEHQKKQKQQQQQLLHQSKTLGRKVDLQRIAPLSLGPPIDFPKADPQDYTDFVPSKHHNVKSTSSEPEKKPGETGISHIRSVSEPDSRPPHSPNKSHLFQPVFEESSDENTAEPSSNTPLHHQSQPTGLSSDHSAPAPAITSPADYATVQPMAIPALPPRTWRNPSTTSSHASSSLTSSGNFGGNNEISTSTVSIAHSHSPSSSLTPPLTSSGEGENTLSGETTSSSPEAPASVSTSRTETSPFQLEPTNTTTAAAISKENATTSDYATARPTRLLQHVETASSSDKPHAAGSTPSAPATSPGKQSREQQLQQEAGQSPFSPVEQPSADASTSTNPPPLPPRSPTKERLARRSSSSSSTSSITSSSMGRCPRCRSLRKSSKTSIGKTVSLEHHRAAAPVVGCSTPDAKSLPDLAASEGQRSHRHVHRCNSREKSSHCSKCSPSSSFDGIHGNSSIHGNDGIHGNDSSIHGNSSDHSLHEYLQLVGNEEKERASSIDRELAPEMDLLSSCLQTLEYLQHKVNNTSSASSSGVSTMTSSVFSNSSSSASTAGATGPQQQGEGSKVRPPPSSVDSRVYSQAKREAQLALEELSQPLFPHHSQQRPAAGKSSSSESSNSSGGVKHQVTSGHSSASQLLSNRQLNSSKQQPSTNAASHFHGNRSTINGLPQRSSTSMGITTPPVTSSSSTGHAPPIPPRSMVSLTSTVAGSPSSPSPSSSEVRGRGNISSSSQRIGYKPKSISTGSMHTHPQPTRSSSVIGIHTSSSPSQRTKTLPSGSLTMATARHHRLNLEAPGQSSTVFIHHIKDIKDSRPRVTGLTHLV